MEKIACIKKKRGLSSANAKYIRQKGHDDALEFAKLIGLDNDYLNDIKAKKDVIDLSGDSHSVKSGDKKWQIFLYGLWRFESDHAFGAMNGIGQLLIECIKSFPEKFDDYIINKVDAKEKCKIPMRLLCEKMQDKKRLKAFINKSIFNGGEVNYFTIKYQNKFHIFENNDVVHCFGNNFTVENSKARNKDQFDDQKVLLRYNKFNIGEIEIRNDSKQHYRKIRFNMLKSRAISLLFDNFYNTVDYYNGNVLVYGGAIKKFGRWLK